MLVRDVLAAVDLRRGAVGAGRRSRRRNFEPTNPVPYFAKCVCVSVGGVSVVGKGVSAVWLSGAPAAAHGY